MKLNRSVTLLFMFEHFDINNFVIGKQSGVAQGIGVLDSLDAIREDVARRFAQSAHDRRSAFHTPVVATADADARVMVLRSFDEANWTMRFHTDARAPKVYTIARDSRVGVTVYDREANLQVRARGIGRVVLNGLLVDAAWESSTRFARRCYLGAGPGELADSPTSGLPPQFEGAEPGYDELAPARENFAVLLVEISEFDWFSLAQTGHRRAVIARESARWITP
ncbi:pyridoxamine 5'-phosphate oxidase family protein [Qipengyuania soli]|nr:pyridoxamine 5'-phosphate oxidase family protein [Qipengyuania soli]